MEEDQKASELPKAKAVSEPPSLWGVLARPFRAVFRAVWKKWILVPLVVLAVGGAAVYGLGYAIWANYYYNPPEVKVVGDSEVLTDGELTCYILHGRVLEKVAYNEEDEIVFGRYVRNEGDTDELPKRRIDAEPYGRFSYRQFSDGKMHCKAGIVIEYPEDTWQDMTEEYHKVQRSIEAFRARAARNRAIREKLKN